jgi:uncharacterized membrane protein
MGGPEAGGRVSAPPAASEGGMPHTLPDRLALGFRLVLAAFYFAAGVLHIALPGGFVKIVPPMVPAPEAVVAFTGLCEIAGAVGLLIPRTRLWAGRMLALYALCVWPANLHHALSGLHVPPLPDSWWYHGPRLVFQPVLIWAALFAGGAVRWPLASRGRAPGPP